MDISAWILGALTLLGVAAGTWFRAGPGKRSAAVADAILGEEPITDRSGKVIRDARPGLVALQKDNANRLELLEEAVVEFRHTIGLYTELAGRMARVESDVKILKDDHIKDLVQAVERASTAASAASVLRMAESRDPSLAADLDDVPEPADTEE